MSDNPRGSYPLEEIIAHVRRDSPFYRRLYEGLPDAPKLNDLPVIEPGAYWLAHGRDRQEILTAKQLDGFVLNSSGTSGVPKFSYSTVEEWNSAVALSARSFDEAGLRDGDRVATLFAAGNLYASLLFATESFKQIRAKVVQFPVGYSVAFAEIAKIIDTFNINVLAGFPTHLLRVIDALDTTKPDAVRLEHIIYAGELFTPDQQESLQVRYPGLQIHSAGYASVEGGPIGYADAGCTASEHRVYDGGTIVEILDEETAEPIEEADRPGRIVFTSLVRRLMPLIRYPTGDLARWVEPPGSPNRKFLLLGRAGRAARIAGYNLDLSEVAAWLEPLRDQLGIEQSQLLVERKELLDFVTLRLVGRAAPEVLLDGSAEILRIFRQRRPDVYESVDAGVLHPPQVEWVSRDQLIINERSGKMLAVVDRRNG